MKINAKKLDYLINNIWIQNYRFWWEKRAWRNQESRFYRQKVLVIFAFNKLIHNLQMLRQWKFFKSFWTRYKNKQEFQ